MATGIIDNAWQQVDRFSHFVIDNTAASVKKGLDFNNIFSNLASPTGKLVDYNIRILAHNMATVGVIYELALVALEMTIWGITECPWTITVHLIFAGICFGARKQMQTELDGFWTERATSVLVETTATVINTGARIYNWWKGQKHEDVIPTDITLTAGRDCGPFGLFKTVSPTAEVYAKVRGEAHLDGDKNDKDFADRMSKIPPITWAFTSLLGVNAYLQGDQLLKEIEKDLKKT